MTQLANFMHLVTGQAWLCWLHLHWTIDASLHAERLWVESIAAYRKGTK